MLKLDSKVDCVFRVTYDEPFLPKCESVIKDYKVLLVCEKQGLPGQHYHCYVKDIKKATLDTRLKKFFRGNKQYSCKVVRECDNQLRYLCKGEEKSLPVIILNQLDVNIVEEYKRFWSDRKNYVESVKEKKKKNKSVIDSVCQRLQETRGDATDRQLYSIRNIFNVILEVCKSEERLVPDDFMMIKYIETVKLRGGIDLEDKLMRITEKMSVRNPQNFF